MPMSTKTPCSHGNQPPRSVDIGSLNSGTYSSQNSVSIRLSRPHLFRLRLINVGFWVTTPTVNLPTAPFGDHPEVMEALMGLAYTASETRWS